jgi:hypothetical protein
MKLRIEFGSKESAPPRRARESGFAYLLALVMVILVIISTTVALENLATQGRRQREEETIWRGNQYTRAIRLFFHKTGHYPQTLDDLEKGLPSLHFLRHAYKNPSNPADGSWRFIYVNAAGQIIGSTRYATLQQMAALDSPAVREALQAAGHSGQPGQPASSQSEPTSGTAPENPSNAPPNTPSNPSGQNPQNPPSDQSGQNPQSPPQPGQPAQSQQANPLGQLQTANLEALMQLKPTGPVSGPVMGGFLTGVGGTNDRKSVKVYKTAKKYKDWEFIWNPVEDAAAAAQQAQGQQGLLMGLPTGILANPSGLMPQPQPNPPQPQPNPQPPRN